METQATTNSFNNDYFVFHSLEHYKLSQEEIKEAARCHEDERASAQKMNPKGAPQKTAPRH